MTARSPVFDALLAINPWAADQWSDRLRMIAAGTWNINSVNQAGNRTTREWLNRFSAARIAATRSRLLGEIEVDLAWNKSIVEIVLPIITNPTLGQVAPGTPMLRNANGGGTINSSEHVQGYSPGQFLADVLLLAQPSLNNTAWHEPLDISGRVFLVGPDFSGARFEQDFSAKGTKFGYFSAMETASFSSASFEGAQFYGVTSWTIATFQRPASFARARFHDAAGFSAATFEGFADFSGARFDSGAYFAGTVFKDACCLNDAHFADYVTFEHSQFAKPPSLDATVFEGPTCTTGLKAQVREAIAAVSRPGQPLY